MTRIAPRLMILLLCGTALAGCAGQTADAKPAADSAQANLSNIPTDLDSGVRQAQALRLAGQYDQAVHVLSQIMLVAPDDPRVVGEYGKTLAQQGRAAEAVQFLGRAIELSPNDWTIYSAIGVAYDQTGDQASARSAYERALTLKPNEPSVLNNFALSRMMANDPEMARQLIARAEAAGGASDPKIARNIALVNQLAPASVATPVAQTAPKPAPAAANIPARPTVTQQALASIPTASAPKPAPTVVMQTVPVDKLAGPVPVKAAIVTPAVHAPHPLVAALPAKTEAVKPDAVKTDAVKTATAKPVVVQAAAVKPVITVKPAAAPAAPVVKLAMTQDSLTPAKIAVPVAVAPVIQIAPTPNGATTAKTLIAPPAPVKLADAKSVKAKDTVPALRMTADASSP